MIITSVMMSDLLWAQIPDVIAQGRSDTEITNANTPQSDPIYGVQWQQWEPITWLLASSAGTWEEGLTIKQSIIPFLCLNINLKFQNA